MDKITHRILSSATNRTIKGLEELYNSCGFKVKINITITYLLIFLTLGCAGKGLSDYQNETNDTGIKNKISVIEANPKIRKTVTKPVYDDLKKCTHIIYSKENITIDLSKMQLKEIRNLKPEHAGSSAYSGGYHECKYTVFDILNIPSPRYSERKRSNINELWKEVDTEIEEVTFKYYKEKINSSIYKNTTVVQNYLILNSTFWSIIKNDNVSFIKILKLNNISLRYRYN